MVEPIYLKNLVTTSCLCIGNWLFAPAPEKGYARVVYVTEGSELALKRSLETGIVAQISREEYTLICAGKYNEPEVKAEEPVAEPEPEVKAEEPEVKAEEPEVKAEEPDLIDPEDFDALESAKEMRDYLDAFGEDSFPEISRRSISGMKEGYLAFYMEA